MTARATSWMFIMLGALLALASPHQSPALADSPAPKQLSRLDDRLMRARKVRITTRTSVIVADDVRVSAEGLAYRTILTASGSESLPSPGRISWDETVRVDVPGNHAIAAGLITGLVLTGVAAVELHAMSERGDDIGGGGIGLLAIPVIALGAAVAGAHMHSWHPVYRDRQLEARAR